MSYVSNKAATGAGSGTVTSVSGSAPGIIITGNPAINPTVHLGLFPITPYVVGPVGYAEYQTIQSGLDAADAAGGGAVYVQPGQYTENLTLYTDSQLIGACGSSYTPGTGSDITIIGQHTPPDTGSIAINNIYLENDSDIFFSTDAGSTTIIIQNCTIGITTSGFLFNLVNWTGQLTTFDIQDASVVNGVVNNTGGASILLQNSNLGAGTTVSMLTSGNFTIKRGHIVCPWEAAAGTVIFADFATFPSTVTFDDNSGGAFYFCRFTPVLNGGGAALVWNSSTILEVNNCIMDSTATYVIDGSGTGDLILGAIDFVEGTGINPALTGIVSLGGFLPGSFGQVGQFFGSNGPFTVPSFMNLTGVSSSVIGSVPHSTLSSASTILYQGPYSTGGATINLVQFIMPVAATLSDLYVNAVTNASTTNVTVTLNVNGATTALVATITALTAGSFSDTTHNVSVSAGDLIAWQVSAGTVGVIVGGISMKILA